MRRRRPRPEGHSHAGVHCAGRAVSQPFNLYRMQLQSTLILATQGFTNEYTHGLLLLRGMPWAGPRPVQAWHLWHAYGIRLGIACPVSRQAVQ